MPSVTLLDGTVVTGRGEPFRNSQGEGGGTGYGEVIFARGGTPLFISYLFTPDVIPRVAVEALPNGTVLVAWSYSNFGWRGTWAQVYNAIGVPIGEMISVPFRPVADISPLPDGRYAIVGEGTTGSAIIDVPVLPDGAHNVGTDQDNLLSEVGPHDELYGGKGNDSFNILSPTALVFEQPGEGNDTITVFGLAYALAAGQEIETLRTGSSTHSTFAVTLTGNEYGQTIIGNQGANILSGEGGDDRLLGYGGHDILYGGEGKDVLQGHGGDDHLYGGAGDDGLYSGTGHDVLTGGTGDDLYVVDQLVGATNSVTIVELAGEGFDSVWAPNGYKLAPGVSIEVLSGHGQLTGNSFSQRISGGAGDDMIDGGGGADRLIGGAGADVYVVRDSAATVEEAAGYVAGEYDTVISWVDYTLGAGQGVERLRAVAPTTATTPLALTGNELDQGIQGNAGANVLNGEGGNDRLYGLDGDDRLSGGSGNDLFYGGAGQDAAVYAGLRAGYEVTQIVGGDWQVIDIDASDGDTGIDFLFEMEVLRFADQDYVLA
ncbi:MAG: calcium-binding protein [Sphingobium sp.]